MSQPTQRFNSRWLRIGSVLLGVLVVLQFIPVDRANPPVKADLLASVQLDTSAAQSLREACYDCHSHETRWPFYARIAPVSWWVAGHVREGRESLNFSDWPADRPWHVRARLEVMTDAVRDDLMPPVDYLWLHARARFTDQERTRLLDALQSAADQLKSAPPR